LGEEKDNPLIIEIPYSIGLAAGIIVFFNHFLGHKITDDPTPIEVEMTEYDKEVTDTILNSIEKGNS
jgi:stage V sporulation protein AA